MKNVYYDVRTRRIVSITGPEVVVAVLESNTLMAKYDGPIPADYTPASSWSFVFKDGVVSKSGHAPNPWIKALSDTYEHVASKIVTSIGPLTPPPNGSQVEALLNLELTFATLACMLNSSDASSIEQAKENIVRVCGAYNIMDVLKNVEETNVAAG